MAMLCGGSLSCVEAQLHGLELHVISNLSAAVILPFLLFWILTREPRDAYPQTPTENDAFDSN
jgi:hypothetical protein